MAVERDGLSSTKGRPLPIDPEGLVVSSGETDDLLRQLLLEMRTVRLILAEAFEIHLEPEELEEL